MTNWRVCYGTVYTANKHKASGILWRKLEIIGVHIINEFNNLKILVLARVEGKLGFCSWVVSSQISFW